MHLHSYIYNLHRCDIYLHTNYIYLHENSTLTSNPSTHIGAGHYTKYDFSAWNTKYERIYYMQITLWK